MSVESPPRNSGGKRASKGLLDLAESEAGIACERTAEVQLQQLNVRLSYHDTLMFRAILASFPRQVWIVYGQAQLI